MREKYHPLTSYEGTILPREVSFYALKAGDLINFKYEGSSRFGLVVASKRTTNGYFLSTRNNTLLNIFLLESITGGKLDLVINILYKDRNRCVYGRTPAILGSLMGKDNFRTFNISKISDIQDLIIK